MFDELKDPFEGLLVRENTKLFATVETETREVMCRACSTRVTVDITEGPEWRCPGCGWRH